MNKRSNISSLLKIVNDNKKPHFFFSTLFLYKTCVLFKKKIWEGFIKTSLYLLYMM